MRQVRGWVSVMSADNNEPQLNSVAADGSAASDAVRLTDVVLSAADHVAERLAAAKVPRDRAFWGGLAVAMALHGVLLIGVGHAVPKMVGEADGSADGISVSVVTEADLRSQSSVAVPAGAAPAVPAPQPQAAPQPPQPQEAPQPPQPPAPEVAAAEPPPPDLKPAQLPETEPPAPSEADAQKSLKTSIESDVPDILALPGPGEKPEPKKQPAPAAKPQTAPAKRPEAAPAAKPQQKRVANLDLTPPPSAFTGSGRGRGAGMERPPGITRSGANDAFARDVIRALQQTMPQLRDVLGRTTVRIILNEKGNVVDVQVVRPANNAIDQSVVFAAKQTSYPFPPPNSNLADRTFLVTYIYH